MKIRNLIIIFVLFQLSCFAQTEINSDKHNKEDYLSKSLVGYEQIDNKEDLQNLINKIKRIEYIEKNNWLASYYISYLDIVLSFYGGVDKKSLLQDSKKRIENLLEVYNSDKSELYTLLGYNYYAKIAENPKENGPSYYKDVVTNYQKAISIKPENPRPNYLLILFEDKMNAFTKKKDADLCQKVNKIKELFKNFEVLYNNQPNWGEEDLKYNFKNCIE